jgi:hypothetical protein
MGLENDHINVTTICILYSSIKNYTTVIGKFIIKVFKFELVFL